MGCLIVVRLLPGQSESGQADLTFQGYSFTSQNQFSVIAGPSVQFTDFVPGKGLLSGRAETLVSDGKVVTGDNNLQLKGLPALNMRWNLEAGDFRMATRLVEFPFSNIYFPEISARGFKVEAARSGWRHTVYAGAETLLEGPRVGFRHTVPQFAAGVSTQYNRGGRLQFGARWLRLSSTRDEILRNPNFFPLNRALLSATTLTSQLVWKSLKSFTLFGELAVAATRPLISTSNSSGLSGVAGAAFDTAILKFNASYTRQRASWLPVLGYFAGDRSGPFSDLHFRPTRWFEAFGSVSSYSSNIEKDLRMPVLRSSSRAAGGSLRLPFKFNVTGQYSTSRFSTTSPGTPAPFASGNSQIGASLARPVGHHNLRIGYRDLKLATLAQITRQRSAELEDIFHLGHFMTGGSVRLQQSVGGQRLTTVYVRGSLQAHYGRFTAYAQFENGNDLLSRSVFSTSNVNTLVAGLTTRIWRGWDLQMEAFRNQLTTQLNPENGFVQAGQGVPYIAALSGFSQSSMFFRLTRHFQWGKPVPAGGLATYAEAQTRLSGQIQGSVQSIGNGDPEPVPAVTVALDEDRTVISDEDGRFRFTNVPEGVHRVSLAITRLPANYDPGPVAEVRTEVRPGRPSAVGLEVWRLGSVVGSVTSVEPKCRENARVRLQPGDRVTLADPEGFFSFDNVREGDYEVVFEGAASTAASCFLDSTKSLQVRIQANTPPATVRFVTAPILIQKPVRRILIRTGQ